MPLTLRHLGSDSVESEASHRGWATAGVWDRPFHEPAASAAQAGTAPDAAPDAAVAGTEQAPPPPAPVTGELILAAERDSWIEITDLNRSRLFFGLIKGGERIGVSGKPPYDLLIGNAPAVTVTFRGAAVDVRRHAINGVARMAVGDVQ